MRRILGFCLGGLLIAGALVPSAVADETAAVRVALLDMSSQVPSGMPGYGMAGQGWGWTHPGMDGYGMMGSGMMMGPGMMAGRGMMAGMMAIRIDRPTVKAGAVVFDVTNWSGSVLHETLIVSVGSATAPLPYDIVQARVLEEHHDEWVGEPIPPSQRGRHGVTA